MWRSAVGSKRPSPPPKEQPIAASRKKRKRPTRLRVKDDQALSALLQFGIYHRAAIADHLLKRFEDAKQPGDRLSIGAEAFFCMIAAVEDLEMLYFAMKEKVVNPKRSFFAEYAGMFIREPAEKKKQKPTDKSARNMRRQLRTTSLGAFQRGLGLPTFEEWLKLDRAPVGSTRQQRSHYFEELRGTGDRCCSPPTSRSPPGGWCSTIPISPRRSSIACSNGGGWSSYAAHRIVPGTSKVLIPPPDSAP